MNIIIEGPDAVGKTTLAEKLKAKYGMNVIHLTSHTRNDYEMHIDLLDHCENTVFDRFHIGEMVYPIIYQRPGKLTSDEFIKITKRIIDNNDLLIVMCTKDLDVLKKRLIERGEENYLKEIEQQNEQFIRHAWVIDAMEYYNFKVVDISEENAYEKLDEWIESRFNSKTINIQYRQLCRDLIEKGHEVKMPNANRGNSIELNNYMFTVDDITNNVIDLKTRNASYDYLAGETLWYWEGRNDVNFISKFGKMWSKLTDDGITNNSAYGYILKYKYDFNQVDKVIELLKYDPLSRRAIININEANKNVITTKDEMCTIALHFYIRNGKLDCTGMMRSNDVIFGLTYDFTYFTQLQKYIASKLDIPCGTYTHFASSLHYYLRDSDLVKKIAYGSLEKRDDVVDIYELLRQKDFLINYIDNDWKSKDDFNQLLKDKGVIKKH